MLVREGICADGGGCGKSISVALCTRFCEKIAVYENAKLKQNLEKEASERGTGKDLFFLEMVRRSHFSAHERLVAGGRDHIYTGFC